jgi:hypothetical protein
MACSVSHRGGWLKSGVVRRGGAQGLRHNKSLNPTALSLAVIKVVWFLWHWMVAPGGGLSPALGGLLNDLRVG